MSRTPNNPQRKRSPLEARGPSSGYLADQLSSLLGLFQIETALGQPAHAFHPRQVSSVLQLREKSQALRDVWMQTGRSGGDSWDSPQACTHLPRKTAPSSLAIRQNSALLGKPWGPLCNQKRMFYFSHETSYPNQKVGFSDFVIKDLIFQPLSC